MSRPLRPDELKRDAVSWPGNDEVQHAFTYAAGDVTFNRLVTALEKIDRDYASTPATPALDGTRLIGTPERKPPLEFRVAVAADLYEAHRQELADARAGKLTAAESSTLAAIEMLDQKLQKIGGWVMRDKNGLPQVGTPYANALQQRPRADQLLIVLPKALVHTTHATLLNPEVDHDNDYALPLFRRLLGESQLFVPVSSLAGERPRNHNLFRVGEARLIEGKQTVRAQGRAFPLSVPVHAK